MPDPTTVNRAFFIPTRGSDSGTWDVPLNSNFSSLDLALGGATTVSTTGGVTTLNATQLQNGTIVVTGSLTGVATILFPSVQGWWTIFNNTTVGNFGLFVACGSGATVIGIPPGEFVDIQVGSGNIPFYRAFGRVGAVEIWAGLTALPYWCANSTVPPYLICDGSVASMATYPAVGARLGTTFGGNGVSTFGLPDFRGRIPLPYDSTGTRITAAGSGLNGQLLGAAQDKQTNTLVTANLPPYTPAGSVPSVSVTSNNQYTSFAGNIAVAAGGNSIPIPNASNSLVTSTGTGTFSGTAAPGQVSSPVNNVQPAQVAGIAVMRVA